MRLPLTQRELAEPLGLTQQALSLKLKGRQVIRAEELRTLALFFDIPMEVFFLPPDEVVRWFYRERFEKLTRMTCFPAESRRAAWLVSLRQEEMGGESKEGAEPKTQ